MKSIIKFSDGFDKTLLTRNVYGEIELNITKVSKHFKIREVDLLFEIRKRVLEPMLSERKA